MLFTYSGLIIAFNLFLIILESRFPVCMREINETPWVRSGGSSNLPGFGICLPVKISGVVDSLIVGLGKRTSVCYYISTVQKASDTCLDYGLD